MNPTEPTRQVRLVCVATCAIPVGAYVSPMHLARGEKTHDCDLDCGGDGGYVMQRAGGGYVVQHAGVHRCRCGVSFDTAGEQP